MHIFWQCTTQPQLLDGDAQDNKLMSVVPNRRVVTPGCRVALVWGRVVLYVCLAVVKKRCLKSQRLDVRGSLQQQNASIMEASYEIAFEIVQQKKLQTIGETLLKPCMMKAINLVLGEVSAKKIQQVSLSNNTIQRRIHHMFMDVKEQVWTEINASPLFSFQLDESTNVSSCYQVLVFVRYIN